ncbi:tetratricopeptide repeat protein [Falsiroseomonas sp.]|uniref:tetratricopeptide repeat protein n=1 Tax=Falsiroseomonas sp. TaxID=2870721 RepID=UPI0034A29F99
MVSVPHLAGELTIVAPGRIAGWAVDLGSQLPVRISARLGDTVLAWCEAVDGAFATRLPRSANPDQVQVVAEAGGSSLVLTLVEPAWSLAPAREALRAEVRHDWPTAILLWRQLVAEEPASLAAWLGLARAAAHGGDPDTIAACLSVAQGLAADDRQRREVARRARVLGRPRMAIELLARLSRGGPNDEALALEHAKALISAGDPKAAAKILTGQLKSDPNQPRVSALLAEARSAAGDKAGAEEIFGGLLAAPVVLPEVRHSHARLIAHAGRLEQALALVADDHALCATLRGEAQLGKKQFEAAEASFSAALAAGYRGPAAALGLATAALAQNAPGRALDALRNVLLHEPLHAEGLMLAARCAELNGDWHIAARCLEMLIHVAPGDGSQAIRLSDLLLARGATKEALEFCLRALKTHSSHFKLTVNLVVAMATTEGITAALNWMRQSRIFSSTERVAEALLSLHQRSNDIATDVLLPYLAMSEWPGAEPALTVVKKLRRAGAHAAAAAWVEVLTTSPAAQDLTEEQWLHLSEVARRSGDTRLAERCLDAAILPDASIKALLGLARAQTSMTQKQRLLAVMTGRANRESHSIPLRLAQIRLMVELGQRAQALATSRAVLAEHPDNTLVMAVCLALDLSYGDPMRARQIAFHPMPNAPDALCDCIDLLTDALRDALRVEDLPRAERLLHDSRTLAQDLLRETGRLTPVAASLLSFASRYGEIEWHVTLLREAAARAESAGAEPDEVLFELLAAVLERAGQHEEALAMLNRLPGQPPDRLLAKARLSGLLGRTAAALADLEDLPGPVAKQDSTQDQKVELLRRLGQDGAAEVLLRCMLVNSPLVPRRIRALGQVLLKIGGMDAELARLGLVLDRFPKDFESRSRLGLLLFEAGRLADADAALVPLVGDPRYNLALLEQHVILRLLRMDYAGARSVIEASGLARNGNPDAARNVAGLMGRLTDRAEAESMLRTTLAAYPCHVPLILALAEQLIESGTIDELSELIGQALAIDPLNPHVHLLLGISRHRADDLAGARLALGSTRLLSPRFVRLYAQLGLLDEEQGDIDGALAAYDIAGRASAATGKDPGARVLWHTVMCRMLRGETEQAIAAHAGLCALFDQAFPASISIWRDGSLQGRELLVSMRGGPGDELRITTLCCPWLIRAGARVTFACDPRLTSLLSRSFPEVIFVPVHSGHRRLRRRDGEVGLVDRAWPSISPRVIEMSIAYDLAKNGGFVCHSDALIHRIYFEGMVRDGVPIERRQIQPDDALRAQARQLLDGLPAGLKVGLCWRGSYSSGYRQRGFIKAGDLTPLLAVEGVRFVNLQVNLTHAEQEVFQGKLSVIPDLDLFDDFDGTAALLTELDLVISLGVSMRDVAGAVGVPVWSFTTWPGAADVWRRGPGGVDVWQPSILHYDLLTHGSSAGIIGAMARDLADLAASHGRGRQ